MASSGRPSLSACVSALWHALASWSKLHANRKCLRDGTRYRVELTVSGTIAGYPVEERLEAWLLVGEPSMQASAHAVPTADLVAWMWQQVPATRRTELQDLLGAYWAEHQELPGLEEIQIKESKLWLQRLRTTVSKEREGPVSLSLDVDPDAVMEAEARFSA